MKSGGASPAPDERQKQREPIEDDLRQAVETTLQELRQATPETKQDCSRRLQEACTALNSFVLEGKLPGEKTD
jgi:hypothetical protein